MGAIHITNPSLFWYPPTVPDITICPESCSSHPHISSFNSSSDHKHTHCTPLQQYKTLLKCIKLQHYTKLPNCTTLRQCITLRKCTILSHCTTLLQCITLPDCTTLQNCSKLSTERYYQTEPHCQTNMSSLPTGCCAVQWAILHFTTFN